MNAILLSLISYLRQSLKEINLLANHVLRLSASLPLRIHTSQPTILFQEKKTERMRETILLRCATSAMTLLKNLRSELERKSMAILQAIRTIGIGNRILELNGNNGYTEDFINHD